MLLLEGFLRSRGNLRELERELGVSYPTIRNRVEALIRALGLSDGPPLPVASAAAGPQVDPQTLRAVLERLARKEITAEEAAAALRGAAVQSPATPDDGGDDDDTNEEGA